MTIKNNIAEAQPALTAIEPIKYTPGAFIAVPAVEPTSSVVLHDDFNTVNSDSTVSDTMSYVNDVVTTGLSVLYKFMGLFSDQAQAKYAQMNDQADRSRSSQQAANQVDSIIAGLTQSSDTGDLPDEVYQYMEKYSIPVTVQDGGKNTTSTIRDYLKSISHEDGKGLNKGQLDVIKGALETDSGRCSDFVTSAQLQIQKLMQSFNVCVSLINSLQTLLSEMMKAISQNIR
ncbi:secretion protein EspA [Salmonella enterica]|nr:secretion protein EspA [Salmonella enterica subsp. enterica serovar Sandiego]EEC0251690.1 secretion protein EspA [Salmonella enterica subsp. enterica]EJW2129031.1 secretion protein EspA [Salmonella enterica]EEE4266514.1 secretion protein EspA [Salmonella enterica subsp. enterica serovar Sandiego]EKT1704963.1 secretion protein EspA [Salmonella enterica]